MTAALLLAGIRITVALAGLLAAIARGVDPLAALATFGVGALILAFSIGNRRLGTSSGRNVPAESPLRAAVAVLYPSSLGLTVLMVPALVLKPPLAALLAGLLAGLGLAAAVGAAQIAWARR
jgi:hypothetical protein